MNTEAYGDALDCACREIGKLQKQLATVTRQMEIAVNCLKAIAQSEPGDDTNWEAQEAITAIRSIQQKGEVNV